MTRAKVLWWDRNGYCLLYKRLHRALFRAPKGTGSEGAGVRIDAIALGELLAGVANEKKRRINRSTH